MPSTDREKNFRLLKDRVLAGQEGDGKRYWRSLEEMADTPEFQEFMLREYPQQAEVWDDPVERRTFLKLMGASLALAGLSGCVAQPPESIVPYVRQPEEEVPGKALFFATAMTMCGVGTGLLVKSNEGRPTKIEGNELHPDSQGATDIFSQASILTLYDPDRSQTPIFREETRPWSAFLGEVRETLDREQRLKQGAGLRFLTETIVSPTLAAQMKAILADFPAAKWHQYEPAARHSAFNGAMTAFGAPVNVMYNFAVADRVFSIDSDFLACGPGNIRNARDFAKKRRDIAAMNRLYVIETTPTNTGAKADHRLAIRPSEIENFVRAVATGVGVNTGGNQGSVGSHGKWITALVNDLKQSAGKSIVIAGDEQPPAIHALAHAMNAALGNAGKTVAYTDPVEANAIDQIQSLRELVGDINNGIVDMLVMVGGNPVYNAPADLSFNKALLDKVKLRIHLSMYRDETSELCHWHLPETHYLEAWSDTRAYDGTASIVQPLIAPLYDSRSAHEFLAAFAQSPDQKGYDIVRGYWQSQRLESLGTTQEDTANPSHDFEQAWRKAVHDGVIPGTALPQKTFTPKTDWANQPAIASTAQPGGFEIIFRTDPTVHDGRFANNGWLQELPKPMTKLTWDNAVMISRKTADDLKLTSQTGRWGGDTFVDTVNLSYQGREIKNIPIWILPGQPDGVITVHLGYGRRLAGNVGENRGFNAYLLRTSDAPWFGAGAQIIAAGDQVQLATTQLHFNMENRDIVRTRSLAELQHGGEHTQAAEGHAHEEESPPHDETMYPNYDYQNQGNELNYAWGMSIDIGSCVGCNACIVACQSENNIPIVGKEQVFRSREMHWLRVDTYFEGTAENVEETHFMPVPCMHCENAPCEPVCPVHATVHSAEGLNDMVYNRCVGTRYCSNNCPYKVRHFNFLLYQDWTTPTYQLMRNPEVSVRSRGVMEKCTYCVQRIQWAKIESEKEGRPVRDGEVVTACQAVCPTEAIVFGNINDPNSRVAKLKANEQDYSLLADLNTRPRTTYLPGVRNPNPEISGEA